MAKLTARAIDALKPDPSGRRDHPDDDLEGLALRVTPAGAKSWSLRYRTRDGQRRRLTLGRYPALSLADARDAARRALGEVAHGGDPAAPSAESHVQAATMGDLWALYARDHTDGLKPRTREERAWLWKKHLAPRFMALPLTDVRRRLVSAELRALGASSGPVVANRALEVLRRMFNVAVQEEVIETSPIAGIGQLFKETARERVLSAAELARLLPALETTSTVGNDVGAAPRLAITLCLLTAARAGEVAGLHAEEIDAATKTWTLAGARTKNGKPHTIPLAPAAWDVLTTAFGRDPAEATGFAFPRRGRPDTPIRRESLTRAMARLVADLGIERATLHDLRRTAATMMASPRIGAPPHVISAILNHLMDGPAASRVYARHRYDEEKREVLERWAGSLTRG